MRGCRIIRLFGYYRINGVGDYLFDWVVSTALVGLFLQAADTYIAIALWVYQNP